MQVLGELPERSLDLILSGVGFHTQDEIVVLAGHD
jgi:hypothetical protein